MAQTPARFNLARYSALILWGFIHGLVAYGLLVWLAHQWWRNWLALIVLVLLGGLGSALALAPLLGRGRYRILPRLLLVSLLLPFVAVIGGDSLHYGYLYLGGPVTLGFALLWALLLLPFALASTLIYRRIHDFLELGD